MKQANYNRAKLQKALGQKFKDVSKNIFYTTRPNAVSESMNDFIIIRLPQGIEQWGDACQLAKGQVSLFARDKNGGLENSPKLDAMLTDVIQLFSESGVMIDDFYSAWEVRLVGEGADDLGFHFLTIQFQIQIRL